MVSKDKVRELIKAYSAEMFAAVVKLCCAPAIFADADKTVSVEFEKGAKQKVRILGIVTNLPGAKGLSAPLLVADIDLGDKELTERSSRIRQFKIARKILEALFDNPPVPIKGFLTQGIFAFHDSNGHFRVSLVTATAENGTFKYNSAKRQSFYVTPDPNGNATFIQRMTMDWSSLPAIKEAFSVEKLTKQFYNEIQNWYFWAQLEDQHVSFPNGLNDDTDDAKFNGENLIRLITRMVFTWFLKEKGLVNPNLFDRAFLEKALVKFDPEAKVDDPAAASVERECSYYRAILQNLFFATFNQEIKRREFVDDSCNDKKRHSVKTYYRNAKLFAEKDPKKILAIFKASPFVNGGLFECLDNVVQKDKETGCEKTYCWDGFSNHLRDERRRLKSAVIPNRLFFCDETTCDLSSVLENKSAKRVKVRGLIRILESYNFTIEENSPSDEEVALDPELLGKVFENLLGCFNPETQKMARNSTGSFYTPREEVNYMVGESLVAYLKRALEGIPEAEIRELVAGGAELDKLPTVKARVKDVLAALFRMKLLDPACGSGAFPMGAMLAVVEMLRTLDPDNRLWRKVVIDESKKAIAEIEDEKERAAVLAEIEKSFDEEMRYPDYARKLYVIEHCIFGSDIQPIAVQISRLRFFISLLCEQKKTDAEADNYGVTPLPNLENNFVAANSLLSVDLSDMRELLKRQNVAKLIRELRETRHRRFLPKTSQQKAALKEKDRKLCDKIDAAAVAAYDEQVTQNIAKYKKELADAKKKRASLSPKELAAPVFDVMVADDLFGGESKVMNAKLTKGKQLDDKISAYEKKIEAIGNLDRKRVLLDNIRRLVKWNPFAFNVAEDFLDPEWMFGVKDGFDVVIGNPPYIQLQANKGELANLYKDFGFETFDRKGDIYCLFYERGHKLLSKNGVLCFITSDKWMRNSYGVNLRNYFITKTGCEKLVDFPDLQIFESATVETNILLLTKEPMQDKRVICCSVLQLSDDLVSLVNENSVPRTFELDQGWILVSGAEQNILNKVDKVGKPLREWNVKMYRGLLTGYNPAFIIDNGVRDKILKEDARSSEIIKPVLRGRDAARYAFRQENFIIVTHNGIKDKGVPRIKIEDYPAVKKHLDASYAQLKKRGDKGDTPYNLRDCAYMAEMDRPKIVWGEISDVPKFGYDPNGCVYCEATTFLMVGDELPFIFLYLNSTFCQYCFSMIGTTTGMGTLRWKKYKIEELKLPAKYDAKKVNALVSKILAAKKKNPDADVTELAAEADKLIYDLYGLTKEEREIVEKACEKPVKEEKKAKSKGEGEGEEKKPKKPVIEEEF